MKTVTVTKELEIPAGVFTSVAALIVSHELNARITDADEDTDTVTLQITCEKEDREIIHEIRNLVEDFRDDQEDDGVDPDDEDD